MSIDSIINAIIVREGGFVNRSEDRGGATKYGITQATLSNWRDRPVTVEEVEALTEAEAKDIYFDDYVAGPRFSDIQNGVLQELVIDFGVNSGTVRAAKALQRAVNGLGGPQIAVDGNIGPNTLKAVNSAPWAALSVRLQGLRCVHYGKIITKDPTQAVFAAGWMNRVNELNQLIARNLAI